MRALDSTRSQGRVIESEKFQNLKALKSSLLKSCPRKSQLIREVTRRRHPNHRPVLNQTLLPQSHQTKKWASKSVLLSSNLDIGSDVTSKLKSNRNLEVEQRGKRRRCFIMSRVNRSKSKSIQERRVRARPWLLRKIKARNQWILNLMDILMIESCKSVPKMTKINKRMKARSKMTPISIYHTKSSSPSMKSSSSSARSKSLRRKPSAK